MKTRAIIEATENDEAAGRVEPSKSSAPSSKPNDKADTKTLDSIEAFKKSKSDKVSTDLEDAGSYTTTSKTNETEKRKRVRKTRRVTSESLLSIDDGARKHRVNKAASVASESQKDEIENVRDELRSEVEDMQKEPKISPNSRK